MYLTVSSVLTKALRAPWGIFVTVSAKSSTLKCSKPVCLVTSVTYLLCRPGQERIDFLAQVRNAAIGPFFDKSAAEQQLCSGNDAGTFNSHPACFQPDWILFINDVVMCTSDIIRLMQHDSADIACGTDFDGLWPSLSSYGKMQQLLLHMQGGDNTATATAAVGNLAIGDFADPSSTTAREGHSGYRTSKHDRRQQQQQQQLGGAPQAVRRNLLVDDDQHQQQHQQHQQTEQQQQWEQPFLSSSQPVDGQGVMGEPADMELGHMLASGQQAGEDIQQQLANSILLGRLYAAAALANHRAIRDRPTGPNDPYLHKYRFYDVWVARDVTGSRFQNSWFDKPMVQHAPSWQRAEQGLPFQVCMQK